MWGDSPNEEGNGPGKSVVDRMVLSFSEGKGGGFFFWSLDRRFLVSINARITSGMSCLLDAAVLQAMSPTRACPKRHLKPPFAHPVADHSGQNA